MKKSTKIAIFILVIAVVVGSLLLVMNLKNKVGETKKESNLPKVESATQLTEIVNKIYEGKDLFSSIETREINLNDENEAGMAIGTADASKYEYLVLSEPMIGAQAYSVVIGKVKDGVDANEVAKELSESVNMRKWICVSAEKLYATSSNDIVFLVMADSEMSKSVYDGFKALAGNVGQEYEKAEELPDFPDDMGPEIN